LVYKRPKPEAHESVHAAYDKLTPEQKKARVGYRTQKDRDTLRAVENMYEYSKKTPSISRALLDLKRKSSLKQASAKMRSQLASYTIDGKHTNVNPKWKRIEEELFRRHKIPKEKRVQSYEADELDRLFAEFAASNNPEN